MALWSTRSAEAQEGPWVAVETTPDSATCLDTALRVVGADLIEILGKREYTIPVMYQREMFDVRLVRWTGSAARRRRYPPRPNSWEEILIRKACLLAAGREPAEDR